MAYVHLIPDTQCSPFNITVCIGARGSGWQEYFIQEELKTFHLWSVVSGLAYLGIERSVRKNVSVVYNDLISSFLNVFSAEHSTVDGKSARKTWGHRLKYKMRENCERAWHVCSRNIKLIRYRTWNSCLNCYVHGCVGAKPLDCFRLLTFWFINPKSGTDGHMTD